MQECVHFLLRASCAVARWQCQRKKTFQITGIEEWETIMASIQVPLEAEMQQKATKTEEDEMQTTATILTIENLD